MFAVAASAFFVAFGALFVVVFVCKVCTASKAGPEGDKSGQEEQRLSLSSSSSSSVTASISFEGVSPEFPRVAFFYAGTALLMLGGVLLGTCLALALR